MNIFIYKTIVTAFVPYTNIYYLSASASDLEWTHVWIAHQSILLMHYSKDSITGSFTGCGFKKKKSVLMSGHNMFKAVILSSAELTESCVLLEDCTFKGKPPWWCLTFCKGEEENGKEGRKEGRRKGEKKEWRKGKKRGREDERKKKWKTGMGVSPGQYGKNSWWSIAKQWGKALFRVCPFQTQDFPRSDTWLKRVTKCHSRLQAHGSSFSEGRLNNFIPFQEDRVGCLPYLLNVANLRGQLEYYYLRSLGSSDDQLKKSNR